MEEGGGEKREGKRLTLGLFNTVRGKCPVQRQRVQVEGTCV